MKQLQDAVRSQYDRLTINYMTTLILCEIHNQHIRQLNVSIPAKTRGRCSRTSLIISNGTFRKISE